jgi:hypothetical protein
MSDNDKEDEKIIHIDIMTPNGYKTIKILTEKEWKRKLERNETQLICFIMAIIIFSIFVLWLIFLSDLTPYNLP